MPGMATRVRSFSKINLGLGIGAVRGDGFHALRTVYQTLALCERVTVQARRTGGATRIVIEADDARVPLDGRNTAWRMVERALGRLGMAAEVRVRIEKRLPVQGGMGAGSANAAAALLGLERELGVELGDEERLAEAAEVGSDVPLFLLGGTVLGEGRGEVVSALPDLALGVSGSAERGTEGAGRGIACVVALPEVGISTPAAFREWDAARLREGGGDDRLTRSRIDDKLEKLSLAYTSALGLMAGPGVKELGTSGTVGGSIPTGISAGKQKGARDGLAEETLLALVRTGIENDFEEVVFPHHPSLRSTKRLLMGEETGAPAVYAAMSGSGSACFGLYRSEADARAAQQRVQAAGVRALLTETLPRSAYWARMFDELD